MKLNFKLLISIVAVSTIGIFISYAALNDFEFYFISDNDDWRKEKELVEPEPEEIVPDFKSLYSRELEILKSDIQNKAKRYKINGSVLIAYKDQVLYREDFGYKDPIQKTPLTPGLSYQLASVSKQYTAAAILKLQEEQLLDINEPVANYLPNFKFESVTIKDLLKHRSGLWNYMFLTEQYWKEDIAPNNLEVVDLINTHAATLNFPAGRYFSYSNTGYVVLGAIVEQISQMTLGDFLNKEFFIPLCLDETYVKKNHLDSSSLLEGYQAYGRSFIKLPAGFHNGALGDKGIYSTPEDLHDWFRYLKNGEILSKKSVAMMFGQDEGGQNNQYGMGFRLDKKGKHPVIFHNGLWDGFRNGLEYHPSQDLVVIVMTHTQNKQKHYFQKQLVKSTKEALDKAQERLQEEANESELIL